MRIKLRNGLSIVLTICMIFTLLPMTVLADNEAIPLKYDWAGDFSEGLALVYLNGKYSFIDKTGKEIISPRYSFADHTRIFEEGLVAVVSLDNNRFGFIDKTGMEIIPTKYHFAYNFSEGFAHVSLNGKDGFIDKTGKEIAPLKYEYAGDFSEGLARVELNSKWGYIDKTGKEIISTKYDMTYYFSEGLAHVELNGKWGFIDKTGKEIVPPKYDGAERFSEGLAEVSVGAWPKDKSGFIDKTGKEIIPIKYDQVGNFSEGMARVELNLKWGYIDKTGKEIVPIKYDLAGHFSEGLAQVKLNDKWGFIDKTGKEIIPLKYDDIMGIKGFTEGLAAVGVGHDKYGFIDKTGKEIIPLKYDNVGMFSEGLAAVCLNGKWGYVSKPSVTTSPTAKPLTAVPTASKVLVNGEQVAFDAYTINGNNYFKLRDIAKVLNGTAKQFEVSWDSAANSINLLSGKAYTAVGGELAKGDGAAKNATSSTSKVLLDGKKVVLTAYTINGNNYFKLRDLGQTFDFGVGWDGVKNTVTIDTIKGYTNP